MQHEHATRRALVKVALWMVADTPSATGLIERKLLASYVCGDVTLDQLLGLAEDKLQTAQAMKELKALTTVPTDPQA